MSIRSKLYLLMLLFGLALLINLIVLGFLVQSATTALTTTDSVLKQQSSAVFMQAQLRDAEAALYRYEMEGEAGFVTRFRNQLNLFEAEADNYAELVQTADEQRWLSELRTAHREAVLFGDNLIEERNLQSADLSSVDGIRERASLLLSEMANDLQADKLASIHGMALSLRDVQLALLAYLDTPREIDRVRFMDGISSFRSYHQQLESVEPQPLSAELEQAIDDIELIGSRMISRRVQRKADYANFALLLFQAGQGIIVDEIQPQAAANIAQAQVNLDRTVRFSIIAILVTIATTSIVFLSVIFPLVQRMNSSILALMQGADLVTEGNLTTTVTVSGQDEFQRLAMAFNEMIGDLATREQRLRELIQKLALVQEEERRLVGLDLHDGLTQMLLSANMHFNAFESKYRNGNGAAGAPQLARGRTRLQEAIDEARWVVSELRPTDLEDYGLLDGLHHYVHKVADVRGWAVEFEADLRGHQLTPSAETTIFRIVQEALSNARKYAATQRVRVTLFAHSAEIELCIKDWGRGFDIATLGKETEHLGVLGMAERAELIGGSFQIESELNVGTKIMVSIPLGRNLQVSSSA